jgi:hypothetical protein
MNTNTPYFVGAMLQVLGGENRALFSLEPRKKGANPWNPTRGLPLSANYQSLSLITVCERKSGQE